MKDFIKKHLEAHADFRERRRKNYWIGGLLFNKYGIEITPKTRDLLTDIVTDILNADRNWRDILKENEKLQGSDYKDKDDVEAKALDSLGYKPSLWQDGESLEAFMARP